MAQVTIDDLLSAFPTSEQIAQMNEYLTQCEKVVDTVRFEPSAAQLAMQWVLAKATVGLMATYAYATAFSPGVKLFDPAPGDRSEDARPAAGHSEEDR